MAIQPIDLSTIYSQMDRIGQMNANQARAASIANQQANDRAAEVALQKSQTVQELAKNEAQSSKIKDGGSQGGDGGEASQNRRKKKEEPEELPPEPEEIKDPRLGRHIDITG